MWMQLMLIVAVMMAGALTLAFVLDARLRKRGDSLLEWVRGYFSEDDVTQLIRELRALRARTYLDRRPFLRVCVYVQDGETLRLVPVRGAEFTYANALTWTERSTPGQKVIILRPRGYTVVEDHRNPETFVKSEPSGRIPDNVVALL